MDGFALVAGFAIGCAVFAFSGIVLLVIMLTFTIHEVPNWFVGPWFLLGCAAWAVAYRRLRDA